MKRSYSQIKPRRTTYVTVIDTIWLYPEINITRALATTTYNYTYDGDFITCPDIANIAGVYSAIFDSTAVSQPVGNVGYSLGVGTLVEDQGKELRFRLTSGQVIIVWRLVKQLTPQTPAPGNVIPVPGNSPNGTIGYITTFLSYGRAALSPYPGTFDNANLVKSG
uniref:Uncharacterized protein n=1 Tax=viral metagenome TaxID=1070528 RepID=A0A6C0K2I0_9ZZZZ